MTDLDKLIEAVENAWFPSNISARDIGLDGDYDGMPVIKTMYAAFGGDLNAALRLHEALLPGWGWTRKVYRNSVTVGTWMPPGFSMGQATKEVDGNTARALLLAILRAYRATKTEGS